MKAQCFSNTITLEAQMFNTIKMITRIPSVINNIYDASDMNAIAWQHSALNLEHFNEIVQKILNMVDTSLSNISLFVTIVKLFALGYLLSNTTLRDVSSVTALLILILPNDVIGNSTIFLSNLTRAVKGIINKYVLSAQVDTQTDDSSIIMSFFELTKMLFVGSFSTVDKQVYQNMSIKSNKVRIFTEYLKSATTIYEYICILVSHLVEYIGNRIFKYYGMIPKIMKDDGIDKMIEKYSQMLVDGTFENCRISVPDATRVIELYIQIVEAEAELMRKAVKYSTFQKCRIFPYLRVMVKHLNGIMDQIPPHIKGGVKSFRLKPYWVYIFGDPRSGKSSLLQPTLVDLLMRICEFRKQYEDPHNYSYFRNPNDKWWDMYDGQPVMQLNDWLQDYSNDESVFTAINEMTQAVDDAPFPLPMANVDKKGKAYFTSKIVISNSQGDLVGQNFVSSKCWSGGEHLYARRNQVIKLILNDKYNLKPGINIAYAENELRNGVKCSRHVDFIPEDMYTIHFMDNITGQLRRVMTFDDALDYIAQDAKQYFTRCNTFKSKLLDNLQNKWVAQMDNNTQENWIVRNYRNFKNKYIDNPVVFHDAECLCLNTYKNYVERVFPDERDDLYYFGFVEKYFNYRHAVAAGCICDWSDRELYMMHLCLMSDFASLSSTNFVFDKSCYGNSLKHKNWLRGKIAKSIIMWTEFKNMMINFVKNHQILSLVVTTLSMLTVGFALLRTIVVHLKPQSAEGSVRKQRVKFKRVKNKQSKVYRTKAQGGDDPSINMVAQGYDQQSGDIENIIFNHFATLRLYIKRPKDDDYIDSENYMRCFCIGGNVFVMPRHYWHRINEYIDLCKEKNIEVRIYLCWNDNMRTELPYDLINVYEPEYEHQNDIVFFQVANLIAKRKVWHFFVNENDDPNLAGSYLYGLRSRRYGLDWNNRPMSLSLGSVRVSAAQYDLEGGEDIVSGIQMKNHSYFVKTGYLYDNCRTLMGDCGMLLMHIDNSTGSRRILGMHTAGQDEQGMSSPIFKEDIEDAIQHFNHEAPLVYYTSDSQYMNAQIDTSTKSYENLKNIKCNIVGMATEVGKRKIKVVIPRKSRIVPSLVAELMYGDFGPNNFAPARLAPFINEDGETISPFYKGMAKLQNYSSLIDRWKYDVIVQHIFDCLCSWPTKTSLKRVLTDEETVNGIFGLKGLDMSTSPGFPYVFINNSNGKLPWFDIEYRFGEPYYSMKGLLLELYNKRIEYAQRGEIYETYYIDTLKDETRPLEKVKLGKTRVFQVSQMDLILVTRKYFGAFVAFLRSTFNNGEIAIGVNPNSFDWTYMAKDLLTIGNKFMCIDSVNFDSTLSQQSMMSFADVANMWYEDEFNLERRTIVASLCNTYHIVDRYVIEVDQADPSGCAVTSDINSHCNMFHHRLAYLDIVENHLQNYNKNIKSKFYGDDDNTCISDRLISQFNGVLYSQVMRRYGLTYTSALKTAEIVPFCSFDEMTFLKRRFVKHKTYNLYLAQLDKDVVMEIARWSESEPSNMSDQMNRFNSTLIELVNYGRVEFNRVRAVFVKYCQILSKQGYVIGAHNLFYYDYAFGLMYPEFSSKMPQLNQDLVIPCIKDGITLLEESGDVSL
jgi:hypothetical protein